MPYAPNDRLRVGVSLRSRNGSMREMVRLLVRTNPLTQKLIPSLLPQIKQEA